MDLSESTITEISHDSYQEIVKNHGPPVFQEKRGEGYNHWWKTFKIVELKNRYFYQEWED